MNAARALGRHVEHDERSRAYAYPEPAVGARQPQTVIWPRYSPILDQGDIGSCTGNAMAGWLGCAPHARNADEAASYDEQYALALYEAATRIDNVPGQYPPDDTGSTGNAVAKAARHAGLIASYSWCFSTVSLLHALQHGPVLIGAPWYESFDEPDTSGILALWGRIRGGHEFLARGVIMRSGDEPLILCDNSWGLGYGHDGSFYLPLSVWSVLRRQQADGTVPHV